MLHAHAAAVFVRQGDFAGDANGGGVRDVPPADGGVRGIVAGVAAFGIEQHDIRQFPRFDAAELVGLVQRARIVACRRRQGRCGFRERAGRCTRCCC